MVWIILVIVGAVLLSSFFASGSSYHAVTTSQLQEKLANAQIKKALIQDKEQTVQLDLESPAKYGKVETTRIQAQYPSGAATKFFEQIQASAGAGRIKEYDTERNEDSILVSLLLNLLPIVFLVLLLFFFMSQMQGGGSRVLNFGKSKAKMVSKDMPKTTFSDVAGADEAVEELHEIKDFLQNPAKYQALGAKIPKGVLLFGPPGTGKTLLARAVAGEAGVPFYSISGSDFVEMFVGVGASRVRDLFEQAKSNAPAIVFVDEIDAVGRHRGAGMGGGHDEREQTLNQLLVEMDGFDAKGGVILIAATNRPDILDPALLRPGRFDRQIAVDTPDMEGRKAILKVHAKGKPFTPDVDLDSVARRTPGFTGADLANVINEAALLAARNDKRAIGNEFLEESIDRVVAGPQRRSRVMSENEKRITAYHEGGHALVAWALPHSAPVHKVTILSRGRSLGHTLVLPTEDKYTQTRAEMIDTLAYALGGRAAEELIFHEPTTGAGNDIEKATNLARAMVTQYGMSSKLGAVKYGTTGDEPFLGRTYGHERDYSDTVAAEIDAEVRSLIELAHDEAWEILVEYRDVLDSIVVELMEKETISTADMARICARVEKRPPMAPYSGNGKRRRSGTPAVPTPVDSAGNGVPASNGGAPAAAGGAPAADGSGDGDTPAPAGPGGDGTP
ncbi:ATP-dependent zinc metalloprotease FtsH [Pilimelia anulata]|uniref:ATP-dependent zinc metalloprotease FtsH n=1 Tax=Pilimelia anulata TaxID=53371 RepID=A0A8J3B5M4_9ACTN|nr:ATP-dependent zinc metalloprotease FtsH [Pilimelia anulata]